MYRYKRKLNKHKLWLMGWENWSYKRRWGTRPPCQGKQKCFLFINMTSYSAKNTLVKKPMTQFKNVCRPKELDLANLQPLSKNSPWFDKLHRTDNHALSQACCCSCKEMWPQTVRLWHAALNIAIDAKHNCVDQRHPCHRWSHPSVHTSHLATSVWVLQGSVLQLQPVQYR